MLLYTHTHTTHYTNTHTHSYTHTHTHTHHYTHVICNRCVFTLTGKVHCDAHRRTHTIKIVIWKHSHRHKSHIWSRNVSVFVTHTLCFTHCPLGCLSSCLFVCLTDECWCHSAEVRGQRATLCRLQPVVCVCVCVCVWERKGERARERERCLVGVRKYVCYRT